MPRLLHHISVRYLNVTAQTPNFRKCSEKLEPAEHYAIFGNKTLGRESAKPGSGWWISVFPALPLTQNGSMRQISEPPTTPLFSRQETAGRGIGELQHGQQV